MAGTWVPADVPAPVLYGPKGPAIGNPVRIEMKGWQELLPTRRSGDAHDAVVSRSGTFGP